MAEASSTEEVVTLRIRWKSETLESFADRYAASIGPTEFFVRTRQPLPPGTHLAFDFTLNDGSPLLAGRGTVVWVRPASHAGNEAPGMSIRFDYLPPESRQRLDRVLSLRQNRPRPGAQGPGARAAASVGLGDHARGSSAEDLEKTEVARFPPNFGPEANGRDRYESAGKALKDKHVKDHTKDKSGQGQAPVDLELDDDVTSPRAEAPSARPAAGASIPWQAPPPPQAGHLGAAMRSPLAGRGKSTPADELLAVTAVQERPVLSGLLGGAAPHGSDDPTPAASLADRASVLDRGPLHRGLPGGGNDLATGPTALMPLLTRQPSPPAVAAPTAPDGPIGGTMELPRGPGRSSDSAELDDADFSAVDEPPLHLSALPVAPPAAGPPRTRAIPRRSQPLVTSEMEAAAWPSPLAPPPSRRRSGTAKTWLATTLGAGVLVIGGLWLLPRFLGTDPTADPDWIGSPGAAGDEAAAEATADNPIIGADTPEAAADPAATAGADDEAAKPAQETASAEPPGGKPRAASAQGDEPGADPSAAALATESPQGSEQVEAAPTAEAPRKRRPRRRRPAVAITAEENALPAGDPLAAPPPGSAAPAPASTAAAPGAAALETPVAANGSEVYWLNVLSKPEGAEVWVDGQVEGKTPFQRRILDPSRAYRVTVRTPGYEAVERTVTGTDQWRKKGNVRTLTVTARLRRAALGRPAGDPNDPFSTGEPASPTPPAAAEPPSTTPPPAESAPATETPPAPGTPSGTPPAATSPPPVSPPAPAPKENPFEAPPATTP